MSFIRIYRFKIFNEEHGAFVDTELSVYAPLEIITSLRAQPIWEEHIEVEESQLNQKGFYHIQH